MNEAVVLIAETVAKAVGVAGVEAMAMRKVILSAWTPDAEDFAEEIVSACIDATTGEVRPEKSAGIIARYRTKLGVDFIEKVLPYIEELSGEAWENGRKHLLQTTMRGVFKDDRRDLEKVDRSVAKVGRPAHLEIVDKKVSDNIVDALVDITGSKKRNVQKTIYRWFKNTQGEHFERFIIPETERLLSYASENEGRIETLNKIGRRYKEFVKAEAHWSAVSEFNMESSKIFSQVQTLHELKITRYTIEATLDEKTCEVCQFLHGSSWDVTQAMERVYDLLISEADNVAELNPFPPRSTPNDFDTPEDSPYFLPPYHPRCRCNIVTESTVMMAPTNLQQIAPETAIKPPSDKLLTGVFNTSIVRTDTNDLKRFFDPDLLPTTRALTGAEYTRVKKAFNGIPYSLRKWARDNKITYQLATSIDDTVTSRVYGNTILIGEKYLSKGVGPDVIQHELRHALINKQIIATRGGARGAEALYDTMIGKKFRLPAHVNQMYRLNGGRGTIAASAAVDEYLAMIGDYYKEGMSLDDLVKAVRNKKFGIEVEKVLHSGSVSLSNSVKWSASEAKKAVELWWDLSDIEDLTLLSKKQLMAKMTHKPSTAIVQKIAYDNEKRLQGIFSAGGLSKTYQLGDNEPFDVWIGGDPRNWYHKPLKKHRPKHVVEVKSIIFAKNDKITMHKDSLARKKLELTKMPGVKEHTVVFDERTGKIYYRRGLGSFRLSTMQEVSESELQKIFGGKPQLNKLAPVTTNGLKFVEITSKKQFKEFRAAMEKVNPKHRDYLTWYSWEEYKRKGTKLYLAADGSAGYGIDPDGTGISLFSLKPGAGKKAIQDGIARGMNRLECFDGKLPQIYGEFGFDVVERYPWNPEFAPKNWDYTAFGEPDFLVMKKGHVGRVQLSNAPGQESEYLWYWKDKPASTSVARVNSDFRRMTQKYDQDIKFEFIPTVEEILPLSKQQKVKAMNEIANELVRMQNKYPNMGDMWLYRGGFRLERINITPDVDVEDLFVNGRRISRSNGESAAQYWSTVLDRKTGREYEGIIQIAIDPDFTTQLNGSGKKMTGLFHGELSLGKDFSISSARKGNIGNALATFDHEVGHAVYASMVDDYQYQKAIQSWNKYFHKNKRVFGKVSVYAKTNADEAFAESFAAFVHPDYGTTSKKKLPAKIHKFFDELLNGNNKKAVLQASKEVEKISQYPIVRTSNITKKTPLDESSGKGVNDSYIITVKTTPKGKSERYLFKPIDGEAWTAKDTFDTFDKQIYEELGTTGYRSQGGIDPYALIRETMDDNLSLTKRELMAYEVFRKLDMAYVDMPETVAVYDDLGEIAGVAVKWNETAKSDWIYKRSKMLREEELFDVAVYDYLIGNLDRHPKNWMRQAGTERLLLIDHGYSFPSRHMSEFVNATEEFRCFPLHNIPSNLDYVVDDEYKHKIVQNLLALDVEELAKRYGMSGELIGLRRRRAELVFLIREGMLDDYFRVYEKSARFTFGYGDFDRDMIPDEINLDAYRIEDISDLIESE